MSTSSTSTSPGGDDLFSFDSVYEFPGSLLETADRPGHRKTVAVVGGGIAGLVASYELQKFGHTVEIFEADDQLGGRVRTHHFNDGFHGELGAMRIPANHYCTQHYVQEFGLELRSFVNFNLNAYYLMRG